MEAVGTLQSLPHFAVEVGTCMLVSHYNDGCSRRIPSFCYILRFGGECSS